MEYTRIGQGVFRAVLGEFTFRFTLNYQIGHSCTIYEAWNEENVRYVYRGRFDFDPYPKAQHYYTIEDVPPEYQAILWEMLLCP